jgi:hypothetical protein
MDGWMDGWLFIPSPLRFQFGLKRWRAGSFVWLYKLLLLSSLGERGREEYSL